MSASENNPVKQGAFPTFRAIPATLLKTACMTPAFLLKIGRCLGRGWKKSWHYLLAIVIIISIPYVALDVYATAQLNHQLNLIRKKGEPLTFVEAAPPKVPGAQNAAFLYSRAAASIKIDTRLHIPAKLNKKDASVFLTEYAKAVDLIRLATAKPQCCFHVDWGASPITVMFPELDRMRNLARLLSLQACYEAETGNSKAALQDVRRLFIMTRHMSGEPTLIGALVSRTIENTANSTLARVLLNVSLSSQQTRIFNASLPIIDWIDVLHRALLTERTFTIYVFQLKPQLFSSQGYDEYSGQNRTIIWYLQYVIRPFKEMEEVYALKTWRKILDNASDRQVPLPQIYNEQISQLIEQAPWYAQTTKILLPVFDKTRQNFDRSEATRREREIALALAAYHSQYQKYPATLQEAEPFWKSTFPLDPYSKKSFCYKRTGKTFLLYSVGMDGKDNGGKWRESSSSVITTDIVWGH